MSPCLIEKSFLGHFGLISGPDNTLFLIICVCVGPGVTNEVDMGTDRTSNSTHTSSLVGTNDGGIYHSLTRTKDMNKFSVVTCLIAKPSTRRRPSGATIQSLVDRECQKQSQTGT